MGEDVGRYGGCFAVSLGLLEEFGPERDPRHAAVGIRVRRRRHRRGAGRHASDRGDHDRQLQPAGARPDREQRRDLAAHVRRAVHVPLVIRMTTGAGRQLAAQHSHSLEGWYAHIPGLRVAGPGHPRRRPRHALDRRSQDPDPVLIFEHGALYNVEGELADDAGPVDIDRAAIRRHGQRRHADHLRRHAAARRSTPRSSSPPRGIDAEVIDLRDAPPARRRHHPRVGRAARTGRGGRRRLAQRQSRRPRCSARITEEAFYDLDAPVAPGVQRRGADPLRGAPGGRPPAAA